MRTSKYDAAYELYASLDEQDILNCFASLSYI